jgi:hypothetical protein
VIAIKTFGFQRAYDIFGAERDMAKHLCQSPFD